MSKLIKAEWFRLVHSGLLKWLVGACILFPIFVMLSDMKWYEKTLAENLLLCNESLKVFMPIFLAGVLCVFIGISYQNKLIHYEIMDGHKIHETIVSRLILYILMSTVGVFATLGTYFCIIALINGIGDIDQIALRAIMFFVILIHICITSVLISIAAKNTVVSSVCIILRLFVLEGMGEVLSTMFSEIMRNQNAEVFSWLSDWSIVGQMGYVFSGDISAKLIWTVLLSLLIECAIEYIISYISLKRKKFK